MKGKTRWFGNCIGWGRAKGENGKNYHVHFANILTPGCGFRSLYPGEAIEFKVAAGKDKKIPEAEGIVRSFSAILINPGATKERFAKTPMCLRIEVGQWGKIEFPQFSDPHPRDYIHTDVSAYYLGHPGTFQKHNSLEINAPWKEVEHGPHADIAVYLVNEEGGILHDRAHPHFKPGHHVVTVQVIDTNAIVTATKIGLRTQDSRTVTHPEDMGVWLVSEVVYGGGLEIPKYTDEKYLKKQIEDMIPAEFEWPTADNRKFAKVIARGIVAVLGLP